MDKLSVSHPQVVIILSAFFLYLVLCQREPSKCCIVLSMKTGPVIRLYWVIYLGQSSPATPTVLSFYWNLFHITYFLLWCKTQVEWLRTHVSSQSVCACSCVSPRCGGFSRSFHLYDPPPPPPRPQRPRGRAAHTAGLLGSDGSSTAVNAANGAEKYLEGNDSSVLSVASLPSFLLRQLPIHFSVLLNWHSNVPRWSFLFPASLCLFPSLTFSGEKSSCWWRSQHLVQSTLCLTQISLLIFCFNIYNGHECVHCYDDEGE